MGLIRHGALDPMEIGHCDSTQTLLLSAIIYFFCHTDFMHWEKGNIPGVWEGIIILSWIVFFGESFSSHSPSLWVCDSYLVGLSKSLFCVRYLGARLQAQAAKSCSNRLDEKNLVLEAAPTWLIYLLWVFLTVFLGFIFVWLLAFFVVVLENTCGSCVRSHVFYSQLNPRTDHSILDIAGMKLLEGCREIGILPQEKEEEGDSKPVFTSS